MLPTLYCAWCDIGVPIYHVTRTKLITNRVVTLYVSCRVVLVCELYELMAVQNSPLFPSSLHHLRPPPSPTQEQPRKTARRSTSTFLTRKHRKRWTNPSPSPPSVIGRADVLVQGRGDDAEVQRTGDALCVDGRQGTAKTPDCGRPRSGARGGQRVSVGSGLPIVNITDRDGGAIE